jgi:hypothetical protein
LLPYTGDAIKADIYTFVTSVVRKATIDQNEKNVTCLSFEADQTNMGLLLNPSNVEFPTFIMDKPKMDNAYDEGMSDGSFLYKIEQDDVNTDTMIDLTKKIFSHLVLNNVDKLHSIPVSQLQPLTSLNLVDIVDSTTYLLEGNIGFKYDEYVKSINPSTTYVQTIFKKDAMVKEQLFKDMVTLLSLLDIQTGTLFEEIASVIILKEDLLLIPIPVKREFQEQYPLHTGENCLDIFKKGKLDKFIAVAESAYKAFSTFNHIFALDAGGDILEYFQQKALSNPTSADQQKLEEEIKRKQITARNVVAVQTAINRMSPLSGTGTRTPFPINTVDMSKQFDPPNSRGGSNDNVSGIGSGSGSASGSMLRDLYHNVKNKDAMTVKLIPDEISMTVLVVGLGIDGQNRMEDLVNTYVTTKRMISKIDHISTKGLYDMHLQDVQQMYTYEKSNLNNQSTSMIFAYATRNPNGTDEEIRKRITSRHDVNVVKVLLHDTMVDKSNVQPEKLNHLEHVQRSFTQKLSAYRDDTRAYSDRVAGNFLGNGVTAYSIFPFTSKNDTVFDEVTLLKAFANVDIMQVVNNHTDKGKHEARLSAILHQIRKNTCIDIHLPPILSHDPLFVSMVQGTVPMHKFTNEIIKLNGDIALGSLRNTKGFQYPAGHDNRLLLPDISYLQNQNVDVSILTPQGAQQENIEYTKYFDLQTEKINGNMSSILYYNNTTTPKLPADIYGDKLADKNPSKYLHREKVVPYFFTKGYNSPYVQAEIAVHKYMLIFNDKSPLMSEDVIDVPWAGGHAAAMSYVHLLAIPHQRVYNIADMAVEDMMILEKIIKEVNGWWSDPKNKAYCIAEFLMRAYESNVIQKQNAEILKDVWEWECDAILPYVRFIKPGRTVQELAGDIDKEMNMDALTIEFYAHMHPFHSVGQLHIHVVCPQLKTKAWNNYHDQEIRLDGSGVGGVHPDIIQLLQRNPRPKVGGKRVVSTRTTRNNKKRTMKRTINGVSYILQEVAQGKYDAFMQKPKNVRDSRKIKYMKVKGLFYSAKPDVV